LKTTFQGDCRPLLIGSLPLDDHIQATDLVLEYTPEIPLWVQLPLFKQEGMIEQFLSGMPSVTHKENRTFINSDDPKHDDALLEFFEAFVAVTEGGQDIETSRFAMTTETAKGFFVFLDRVKILSKQPLAVKGQITGPITFCTALNDQDKRAIFYNESLRDAGVKLLALKAAFQVKKLRELGCPVIVFIDEPALAGFGSSEFISISAEDISECIEEVIDAIHAEGGMAGIHVCANTDWSLILESSVDIVNFDAYAYFDKFILYKEQIKRFVSSKRLLAWGLVPTLNPDEVAKETVESLFNRWQSNVSQLSALGVDLKKLQQQSLITPACGTGSLNPEQAKRVLELTRGLSDTIRGQGSF